LKLDSLSSKRDLKRQENPGIENQGARTRGEFDAKTSEHLRPANTALPFDTVGDRPVAINSPGAVESDSMFDSAEFIVDNDQRSAQRR